jgi:hypothetical protein
MPNRPIRASRTTPTSTLAVVWLLACSSTSTPAASASGGSPGSGGGSGSGGTGTGTGGASSGGVSGSGGTGVGASGGATGTGSGGNQAGATGGSPGGGGAAAAPGGATAGGGNGGGATGAGGGPSGACPSGAIFCADFESGTLPTNAVFFPEYLRPMIASYVTIDGTVAHGGTKSARFAGTSFSQMLGVLTNVATFWARVYLRSDADMSTIMGHATYVAATDGNGDPNMGQNVRVGEHVCQLELNRSSDDKELLSNGGDYNTCKGIAFAPNTWNCLETFYDGPNKEVRVFVNGAEVTPLHATDWGPYTYTMFKFGFENYSSPMRNMWYDDVAIATQRIGCLP